MPPAKIWILGIIGFMFSVSSFILFDLRHNFLMTASAFKLFTNTQKPLSGYEEYANLGFRVMDRIIGLGNSFLTPLFSKDTLASLILVAFLILSALIISKRFLLKEIKIFEKEYFFLLVSPFLIFGIYILYPLPLWPHYLLPIAVLSSFILSLSIYVLWQKPILKPIILVFIILSLISPLSSVGNEISVFRKYQSGGDGSYLNQLQVAKWVLSDARNKDASYFVYAPGVLTYGMDYLFWWLSESNNIAHIPSDKSENTYLILYQPLEGDNAAHEFWKRNVVKISDEPVFSRTFNGGIIVEKYDLSEDEIPVDPNYYQNLIFR